MQDITYKLKVDDMSCQHCVKSVTNAATEVPHVESVRVDLELGQAQLMGGDPDEVIAAIINAGFPASLLEDREDINRHIQKDLKHDNGDKKNSTLSNENSNASIDSNKAYTICVEDMTCSSCVANVQNTILQIDGVNQASVNLLEKKALVEGGDAERVVKAIIEQGYQAFLPAEVNENQIKFVFQTLTSDDQTEIKQLLENDLVEPIRFDALTAWVLSTLHPAELLLRLRQQGYSVHIEEQFVDPYIEQATQAKQEIKKAWQRSLIAGSVGFGIMIGDMGGYFPQLSQTSGQGFWSIIALLCLVTMWISGKSYYLTAAKLAKHLKANMDTLVALGTAAAWISSVIVVINPNFIPGGGNHLYFDASVMILAFLQFGHALEISAKRTTSEAIGSLVGLNPKTACVVRDNEECLIPVSLLQLGDQLRVRPGEQVPIDGIVLEGTSTIDESMLTGEPLAIKKSEGENVIGGTINQSGSLLVKVTAVGEETTLAHIIDMVKQAQISKPEIGRIVDKISAIFVPSVIAISILTFIAWQIWGPTPQLAYSLTTAIAVLVIACPCALGLATPIAIMVATARAAQLNILIKNSNALQSASEMTALVVDKTGTLTEGRPQITDVIEAPTGNSENQANSQTEEIIRLAAALEFHSEHPLATAVLEKARTMDLTLPEVQAFNSIEGQGIRGVIAGKSIILGNQLLMQNQRIDIAQHLIDEVQKKAKQGGTPIWLAQKEGDGQDSQFQLLGALILSDPLRADTIHAVEQLHQSGLKVIMCTGDNRHTAETVAKKLNIDTVYSEVLPADKLAVVEKLQAEGHKVGMVGDGVNDAPALALADTSFAIGAGTDVAIHNADITLAANSLETVNTAIELSRQSIKNIKQNLFGAFIYNSIGIPLAAGVFFPVSGWLLQPMFASFAMAMSSVTVVTNANRLRFFKAKTKYKPAVSEQPVENPNVEESSMSETIQIAIEGMSCNHCVGNAQKALQAVPGVETVEVSLENKSATITGSAERDSLVAAVNAAGYEAS